MARGSFRHRDMAVAPAAAFDDDLVLDQKAGGKLTNVHAIAKDDNPPLVNKADPWAFSTNPEPSALATLNAHPMIRSFTGSNNRASHSSILISSIRLSRCPHTVTPGGSAKDEPSRRADDRRSDHEATSGRAHMPRLREIVTNGMIDPRSLCRRPRGIVAKSNIPGPRRDRTSWQPKRTRMPALTQLHGERYLKSQRRSENPARAFEPPFGSPPRPPEPPTRARSTSTPWPVRARRSASGATRPSKSPPVAREAPSPAHGSTRAEITGRDGFNRGMRLLNHKYRPWKQLLDLFSLLSPGHRRIMLAIREPASPS